MMANLNADVSAFAASYLDENRQLVGKMLALAGKLDVDDAAACAEAAKLLRRRPFALMPFSSGRSVVGAANFKVAVQPQRAMRIEYLFLSRPEVWRIYDLRIGMHIVVSSADVAQSPVTMPGAYFDITGAKHGLGKLSGTAAQPGVDGSMSIVNTDGVHAHMLEGIFLGEELR